MEFKKKRLSNGLSVIFEKRQLPVVSVSASVKWGSAYESAKIKGISHFIEHLMFKGTKTRDQEEIAREIERKGGILNAFTSEEVTSYWNKLPSKHIETGLAISSDLILNPRFDKEEFEKEKQVIIEEIKMYHDNPRFYVMDKIKEMLYGKPFGMSIAGTEEIVRGISRKEVIDLFNSVYTSDSMILAVVGNADFDEICKKAEKIFPKSVRNVKDYPTVKKNAKSSEERAGIDQAHYVFGFHSPTLKDRKRYDYELAATHLFGGMSSRLFQEIREKRGLAYAIKGDFDMGKEYGYCTIYAGTKKDKINEIRKIIVKEIKELSKVKQRDFEELKEQLIGNKRVEEEDSSQAMNALMIEESAGDAEEYYKYEERINSVKLSDVQNIKVSDFSDFSLIPK